MAPPWHADRVQELTRRALLGLGAGVFGAAGLAACTSDTGGEGSSSASASDTPDPDGPLATDVIAAELRLIAAYDAALAASPSLTETIAPIRDQHREHVTALGGSSTETPSPDVSAPTGDAAAVIEALMAAERDAVAQRTTACQAASGAEFAGLLALIAASEAGHVEYLRGSAS